MIRLQEVAKIALERLIVDGRIHPARIEEMVEKAQKDVNTQIREAGEQATFETVYMDSIMRSLLFWDGLNFVQAMGKMF